MKEIIKGVLKNHSEMNSNLESKTVRDIIAIEIIERLKKKGFYTEYSKEGLREQEAKKDWVCQTCGKSTFETDYDYLVHPKLHLGCALKEELKGKDIKEQYLTASESYYKDKKGMKPLDWWKKDNPQLESLLKNKISKVEGPEYDSKGSPTIPYLPGKYTESVEEPEGLPYTPEEIKRWEKETSKLSEEIVDNKDKKYIYESPDGGETIYRREFGTDKKELVKDWNKEKYNIKRGTE